MTNQIQDVALKAAFPLMIDKTDEARGRPEKYETELNCCREGAKEEYLKGQKWTVFG